MRRLLAFILPLCLILISCDGPEAQLLSGDRITIAYAEAVSSYSPINFEAKNRKYLVNIYEPLVRYDKAFNTDTALAVSWGRTDDLTWEFHLREGVLFHDGSIFEANDAVYSLELARSDVESQLGSLLSNVQEVKKIDDYKIEIKTFEPDPLLLNKLTNVYMVPAAYRDFDAPLGTGPYYIEDFEEDTLILKRFENYWGAAAFYEEVGLAYIPGVDDRLNALLEGEVQVLANVPPQHVDVLREAGFEVEAYPSLEVSYLMFNLEGAFKDPDLRAAVWHALGIDYAERFGEGYLLPTDQYAALGIFGYIPEHPVRQQNLEKAIAAQTLVEEVPELTLDIPLGLEPLGEDIAVDLEKINLNVTVNALGASEFQNKILSGQSDFYFFGWKYDLADVADFYEVAVHSKEGLYGAFNGIHLEDVELDLSIEKAAQELDISARRQILIELNDRLLATQSILPLFEAQVIYGISPDLHWAARLDGQILASEILQNMVE